VPSFTLRIAQGVQVDDCDDPPGEVPNPSFDPSRPPDPATNPATRKVASRQNPEPGYPHRNYQTTVGRGVVVKATPDGGVEGAPDVDLDTHPFSCWFAEYPAGSTAIISQSPGYTSVASFVPDVPGNYLLVFCREQGGSIALPIEVKRP
jgi:hypothetical protein